MSKEDEMVEEQESTVEAAGVEAEEGAEGQGESQEEEQGEDQGNQEKGAPEEAPENTPEDTPVDAPTLDPGNHYNAIRQAIRKHKLAGKPEVAAKITALVAEGSPVPRHLVYDSDIKPEKFLPKNLEIPPRAGPGATHEAWLEFALDTTDMEREVVEKMSRKDIISMLEVKKVIPKEGK